MSTSVAFDLGSTYHGVAGTIPSSYTEEVYLEGLENVFPDLDSDGVKLSGVKKYARIMRNVSGVTLYGGMAVVHKPLYRNRRIGGNLASNAGECAGIIDDTIPSTGVRDGDLCWVIFKGPAKYRTDPDDGSVGAGDFLLGLTDSASTGGTDSDNGHLVTDSLDSDTKVRNVVGVADEASTSDETNTLKRMLVFIKN